MKGATFYQGREQTFVKHFFLENYLERVAFNILWSEPEFVYVDCFSGPWKSQDEKLRDTSFSIAIARLLKVKRIFAQQGKQRNIQCLFIEKDPAAYGELKQYADEVKDVRVTTINGAFEDSIGDIVNAIGKRFALTFVDPTGWKGVEPSLLAPILQNRGEVLINFMFNFVNRFLSDDRPEIASTINAIFLDLDWRTKFDRLLDAGLNREAATLELYKAAIRKTSEPGQSFVTSTAIKNARAERTHFHLVYRTRSWKGIYEFRGVEKKSVVEQDKMRRSLKPAEMGSEEQMSDLFAGTKYDPDVARLDRERAVFLELARRRLNNLLAQNETITMKQLVAEVLQTPLVWFSDVQNWTQELAAAGVLEVSGLKGRSRRPNLDCSFRKVTH